MIRETFAAAVFAALCASSLAACSSDSTPSTKGDGAAGAPGPDAGSGGSGGVTGDTGAAGTAAGGSAGSGTCGTVFGHAGACKTCLEAHCCDLGTACSGVPDCVALAQCAEACDAKAGSKPNDQCHSDCAVHLTAASRPDYNGLVQCMAQSCLSECPFSGP